MSTNRVMEMDDEDDEDHDVYMHVFKEHFAHKTKERLFLMYFFFFFVVAF